MSTLKHPEHPGSESNQPSNQSRNASAAYVSAYVPMQRSAWARDDRGSLLIAGMMWTLIVLMIVPEGFNYDALINAYSPTSGGAISRLLWLSLLASGMLVIAWRAALAWLLLRTVNPFLLLFIALAACSVVWSIEPTFTIRRVIRILTIVVDCFAFALIGWHAQRFQTVVRKILTIMLAGSIVFGLLYPMYAIHQETSAELVGAWRGLANHKNTFGALSSITLIFWFHAGLSKEVRPIKAIAGCALAAFCLYLSRSSTSAATSVVVMLLLAVLLRARGALRAFAPYLIVLLVLTLLTYALAILNVLPGSHLLLAPITALTGKDTSFTGRAQIWELISQHIQLNPIFGTGYGAYWIGPVPRSPSYQFIERMQAFYPGSAHNGYLEILNDLGWAGLGCLLLYIANYIWQALQLLRIDSTQCALLLGLFFQQVMTNLSETHWFSVLSVDFVIMTLATVALARALLDFRLKIIFGAPHLTASRPMTRTWAQPGRTALARAEGN